MSPSNWYYLQLSIGITHRWLVPKFSFQLDVRQFWKPIGVAFLPLAIGVAPVGSTYYFMPIAKRYSLQLVVA